MNWQPIETAPKDGTSILCYSSDTADTEVTICEWRKHKKCWMNDTLEFYVNPAYWAPLPEPPK